MRISPILLALAAGLPLVSALDAPTPPPANLPEGELHWGAYGELHYNNFAGSSKTDQIDLHRLVLLAEYAFNERIRFVGEIEYEHGLIGEGKPGEVEIEQAYIDFRINDRHAVKAGLFLVPISWLNTNHEPPLFHGVERPFVESAIIPTTWWEAGVALHGELTEDLDYQIGVHSSLDSDDFSSSGIRSGRQKVANAKAEGLMASGRLDWRPRDDLRLGFSALAGTTVQDEEADSNGTLTMVEADGAWTWEGLEISGTVAYGSIADAEDLPTGTPEAFHGAYLTVAYDVFRHWADAGEQTLDVFARYEIFDTQAEVPDGVTENEARTGSIIQVGLTWQPIANIAVKLDYQDWDNDADSAVDQWNMGIGFAF